MYIRYITKIYYCKNGLEKLAHGFLGVLNISEFQKDPYSLSEKKIMNMF